MVKERVMQKKKSCDILAEKIITIWELYAYSNAKNDWIINEALKKSVVSLGEIYIPDIELTVYQMTNSHKRILLKELQKVAKQMTL